MNIIKIKKTPKVEDKRFDVSLYHEYTNDFVNTLKDKNLNIFFNNLPSLRVEGVKQDEMNISYASGEYNPWDNKITHNKYKRKEAIMHELLHSASRIKTDDRCFVGFMQTLPNEYCIGVGLNEGYTALLDDRYFLDYSEHKKEQVNKIYPCSKYICNILDYLIGKDKMEEYYFNADLLSLFKELASYSSNSKAYKFLLNFDHYFMEADTKEIPNMFKVINQYDDIILFLSECFMTKFRQMYNNKELTKKEYETCLLFVKHIMNTPLEYLKVIKSRRLIIFYDRMLNTINNKVDNKSKVK